MCHDARVPPVACISVGCAVTASTPLADQSRGLFKAPSERHSNAAPLATRPALSSESVKSLQPAAFRASFQHSSEQSQNQPGGVLNLEPVQCTSKAGKLEPCVTSKGLIGSSAAQPAHLRQGKASLACASSQVRRAQEPAESLQLSCTADATCSPAGGTVSAEQAACHGHSAADARTAADHGGKQIVTVSSGLLTQHMHHCDGHADQLEHVAAAVSATSAVSETETENVALIRSQQDELSHDTPAHTRGPDSHRPAETWQTSTLEGLSEADAIIAQFLAPLDSHA